MSRPDHDSSDEDRIKNRQFAELNRLRRERARVDIYLVTGTRLQGRIQSFDGQMLLLHTDHGDLALYHHAVSSVQKSTGRAKRPRTDSGQRAYGAEPPGPRSAPRRFSEARGAEDWRSMQEPRSSESRARAEPRSTPDAWSTPDAPMPEQRSMPEPRATSDPRTTQPGAAGEPRARNAGAPEPVVVTRRRTRTVVRPPE